MRLRYLVVALLFVGCGEEPTPSAIDVPTDVGVDAADATPDSTNDVAEPDATNDILLDAEIGEPDPPDATEDADSSEDAGLPPFVTYLYDPYGATQNTMPDDALTVADPSTETGLRIALGEQHPWFTESVGLQHGGLQGLNGLDGWGTNAAISFVFDGPVGELPSGEGSAEASSLRLLEFGEETRSLPFEIVRTEDGGFLLTPMFPLRAQTRHAVVGTTELLADDGREIVPGPTMSALLAGAATGELEPMNDRYQELLVNAELTAEEVAFATVFTTQSALPFSLNVAEQIRGMEFEWNEVTCAPETPGGIELRHCETSFDAFSWRDEDGVLGDGEPVRTYTLPVSIWLPQEPGPHPTAIFGHGLAHGREVSRSMAELVVPFGLAVVAIDAVAHGEHPDAPEDDALVLFEFFALSLNPLDHDPRVLRDNFRQSTWDKLQLMQLLEASPNVDGEGEADLDLDQMIYLGESFGGIMAIEFLALTDRFSAAGLQLGGGAVTRIISQARRFEAVRLLAGGSSSSESARFFPIVQAVADAGDASTWAPFVLQKRLPEIGGEAPHMLLQLVIDDDTIPDGSSDSVVRALGLEQVPPVARVVPLASTTGAAPISGNLDGRTLAFFQFDRVRRGLDSEIEVATHDYTPGSDEAKHQLREFVRTWLEDGVPTIVDPFADLGTPEL